MAVSIGIYGVEDRGLIISFYRYLRAGDSVKSKSPGISARASLFKFQEFTS